MNVFRQGQFVFPCSRPSRPGARLRRQGGKVLVMFAIVLPALLGVVGLSFDTGLILTERRHTQHAADAAATAAAMDLQLGKTSDEAIATAQAWVQQELGMDDAQVTVNIPPLAGDYAGDSDAVEVLVTRNRRAYIMPILGSAAQNSYQVRATAALEDATSPLVVVVLDPSPAETQLPVVPLVLPNPLAILGGLEVEGLGSARIDGAVAVNCQWGGVDENNQLAGLDYPPPFGATCTPLLPLTGLRARDIRVVGGVNNADDFRHFLPDQPSPLHANRLPTPDPLIGMPAPTVSADPTNVNSTLRGGVSVLSLSVLGLGPTVRLYPGVYEWIDIVLGKVVFEPGVYIIRGKHPVTGVSLGILGGQVTAEGVMFYITDSAGYDAAGGSPDGNDGETEPAEPVLTTIPPSVIVTGELLGSRFTPLNSPDSPFDGMLLYQRRQDRRPIVMVTQDLLGSRVMQGRIYAKWANTTLVTNGDVELSIAAGSVRILTLATSDFTPSHPFPAAKDVYLVE
ncbi:pilus assembly protein TadG-related protein [Lignipirellula cremea]|uniref:Putative Flp pilus-assembly TadG-like N-terminal domain-containing protein n=1 Tax=Lignipirellula cremea TaxID=2528010 RepID=A0A518DM69_9BACT|nr:pilus assembly protein TadG-related protein [Lignipirellula cremea]QDU92936.1 hypothetical protein Pla8534_07090 [Lignipirellula cremea]